LTRWAEWLRDPRVRGAGLWALVLCTACLLVENTLLLSWAATTRPGALLVALLAVFKLVCALSVPVGLVLATAIAGWYLPRLADRDARLRSGAVANGGRHER
jgi:hypothetical protein